MERQKLVMNLYLQQRAVVKVMQEFTEESEIGRRVRQGCCLSPLLFNLYVEEMMLEAMEGIEEGIKIGGKLLKDVRFADNQAMVASSEEGLQKIMDGLNRTAKEYEMKLNIKKTKVIRVPKDVGGQVTIMIEGKRLNR